MNESDLDKYLVLKLDDIKNKLSILEQQRFWGLVSYIIFKKEDGYKPPTKEAVKEWSQDIGWSSDLPWLPYEQYWKY